MRTIIFILSLVFLGTTFSQGQPSVNRTDDKGRKQGPWMKRYPNNTILQYKGQFKDDKPQGRFHFYYDSGKTRAVVDYRDNGKLARSKMFHETGEVMGIGNYVDELKDSVWTYFDRKGLISMRESYNKGTLNGKKTVYYTTNQTKGERIAEETEFKNGTAHGEWKQYFQSGVVKSEGKFVDGNYDGLVKYFHPNGKISHEKRYKNAVLHGWQRAYDENGKLLDEKLYLYNRLIKGEELEDFKKRHSQGQIKNN